MPRQPNVSVQNSFIKGLVTEATALSFPENACTETDNCIFDPAGLVSRRPGFDFESDYEEYTVDVGGSVIVSYLWTNVSNEGDISFVVEQIGDNLHFYEVSSTTGLSGGKHATVLDLMDFAPTDVDTVATLECQFTSGNGVLFVTNPRLNTFFVEYDVDTDTFSTEQISIQIRDFEGDIADTLAVDVRPTSTVAQLSPAHRYNLFNQGWTAANLTKWDTATGQTTMPSNADVSWRFKDSTDKFVFSKTAVEQKVFGNSPAPKGHFIYSIYDIDRDSNVTGATSTEILLSRVSTCAFFAGRVFYAGLREPKENSKIFFSQIIEKQDQYGKCYQVNDPTSEHLFDLLPSDGGVIDLLEAGTVIKMMPVMNYLIMFCTNGIWALTGSQGAGFTANDYSVAKISAIRCLTNASFVDVEGIPYWWNLDGIHTITLDPQSNALRVVEISEETIKSFFDTIPVESKSYARGTYDPLEKKVVWIYRSVNPGSFEDRFVFDRVLNYNLRSKAFYTWSVDRDDVHINSLVSVASSGGTFELTSVIDGADTVVDGSDTVIVFLADAGVTSTVKYFVSYSGKVTFAENYRDTYLDWESFDDVGVEYDSYFVTGYMVRGQGIRKFQTNYVNVFCENSVDSSFKILGQWDYSTTGDTGKWSTAQTFSISANDFAFKPKRIKIRGHGYACQFRISNNGTNPFNIVGWAVGETGNAWL